MSTSEELNTFIKSLSPARQKLIEPFFHKDWFKNTDLELRKEILSLPEDHNGFIEDLSNRPDEIGEVDVLRLLKLAHGNYLLIPVFEVRSNITNQIFTYEYASWKSGARPGAKGIIFLETDGEITHFLVAKEFTFSTVSDNYEALGGLYIHFLNNKPINLPRKIESEICFHLGIDHVEFKKIIDLGVSSPDLGLSNNVSDLFAAIIDISHLPNLVTKADFRSTHKPIGFELKIIHISQFKDFLNVIRDNYFLSAAARVLVNKDISLNL